MTVLSPVVTLCLLGDLVSLLGTSSKMGDSGSPYLIILQDGENFEVAAIGVHAFSGPIGIRLTSRVWQDMIKAIDSREV